MNIDKSGFEQFRAVKTLHTALHELEQNGGFDGVNRQALADYVKNSRARLDALSARLRAQAFPPPIVHNALRNEQAYAEKEIELRIVMRALQIVLDPCFRPRFNQSNFSYGPNGSAEAALRQVSRYRESGDVVAIVAEIECRPESLDQDRLMEKISEATNDDRLNDLIWALLKRGVIFQNAVAAEEVHALRRKGWRHRGSQAVAELESILLNDKAVTILGIISLLPALSSSEKTRRNLKLFSLALALAALATMFGPRLWRSFFGRDDSEDEAGHDSSKGGLALLFENILLNDFDLTLTSAGCHVVRYDNQILIATKNEHLARVALEAAVRKLNSMNLRLNPLRTRIARFDEGIEFLGRGFHPNEIGYSAAAPDKAYSAEWWEFALIASNVLPGNPAVARLLAVTQQIKDAGGKKIGKIKETISNFRKK